MSADKSHWEGVYGSKAPDTVSWYQPTAERSLALIQRALPDGGAPIVDVGGGASVLVDELLERGCRDVTVVDLAASALATARARLGERAGEVQWIEGDIRTLALPAARYALWHDRAVFHFLTDPADRDAYRDQLKRAMRPDGFVLIATFAEDGPVKCSGLPVVRFSEAELRAEVGAGFELVTAEREAHRTPAGATQSLIYCLFRRTEGDPRSSAPHRPDQPR